MVDVSSVQALNHKVSRESKVLAHFNGLLVDYLRREVLSDAAVVNVA